MTEVDSSKVYKYDFTEVPEIDYVYVATVTGYSDMSGTVYRDQQIGAFGGGGFSIDYSLINSHTTRKVNELWDKIEKIPKTDITWIESKLNEIDSQNKIDYTSIIDTIKEESNEVSSDVIRKTRELEESNIKTRNLVRQKTEKIDKNVSRLSDRQDLTDKLIEEQAEEIEEELERIYEQEADMLENEINAQFEKEADEIELNS